MTPMPPNFVRILIVLLTIASLFHSVTIFRLQNRVRYLESIQSK